MVITSLSLVTGLTTVAAKSSLKILTPDFSSMIGVSLAMMSSLVISRCKRLDNNSVADLSFCIIYLNAESYMGFARYCAIAFFFICANVKQKKFCRKFFDGKCSVVWHFLKIIAAKNKKWLNLCRKN